MVNVNLTGTFVYILSLKDGRTYTGITGNPARRFMEHATGRSKSTSRYLPISLIHTVLLENYKQARLLEVKIKNRGAKKWLSDSYFRDADIKLIRPGDDLFPSDGDLSHPSKKPPRRTTPGRSI